MLLSGCSSTEQLLVERTEPARLALAGVRKLGVLLPLAGESGEALAVLVSQRLAASGLVGRQIKGSEASSPGELLRLSAEHGLDALLSGRVEWLEGPLEGVELDAQSVARIRARIRVVLADGTPLTAPPVAIVVTGDELQELVAAEQGWRAVLLARAAARIVDALVPRTVDLTVEWELADGWDEDAWERFASRDYAAARVALEAAIRRAQEAGASDASLGALYYDLALTQDLLGDFARAERSYDEALTLSGTELHLEALRAFRARLDASEGGGG